jgi:hypothetical protein
VTKSGNRLILEPEFTSAGDDDDPEWRPDRFALEQPSPNPFRSSTSLSFDAPTQSIVTVEVYDIRGHFVKRVTSDRVEAGRYRVRWDGRDAKGRATPSGIYLIHMKGGDFDLLRKVVKIR